MSLGGGGELPLHSPLELIPAILLLLFQCERAEGIDMFFSQIFREPTIMAVVGTGCSSSTEPTAEVSHYYNISQVCQIESLLCQHCIRVSGWEPGHTRSHGGQCIVSSSETWSPLGTLAVMGGGLS